VHGFSSRVLLRKTGVDMAEDKKQIKAEQKALKAQEKADKKAQRADEDAKGKEMAGREVASEFLSVGMVKIFQNGYISVGNWGRLNYEKLISFDVFSANLTKKSGLGRGVAAVLTLGVNLYSPNTRGNLIVTIVTDKKVHSIEELPQVNVIRTVQKLEAAAKSVIKSSEPSKSGNQDSSDLGASLEKLVSLKNLGALTEAEFEKAKAKLLS
jgi:hypothetical protein